MIDDPKTLIKLKDSIKEKEKEVKELNIFHKTAIIIPKAT